MSGSRLFEPLRLCNFDLEHRVAMAPLTRLRADKNHVPGPMMQEYYTQRAAVPGTLLIAEATLISPTHAGVPHAPGMWSESQIAGWRKITDAVHAKECRMICQLVAPGRAADLEALQQDGGSEMLCSSAMAMPGEGFAPKAGPVPVPKEMSGEDIQDCIRGFAQAAENAIAAGFDGVELHGANGYLIDQFLQDTCNQRTDRWGSSVENRCRFALEVTRAVSNSIGADRTGFRVSPWSEFQGMRMQDPVTTFSYLVTRLKDIGLGYLHIIEARVNNNVDVEASDSTDFLLKIWDNATPVLIAGGNTPANVFDAADEKYKAYDVVFVFGRHFLANPDLPFRLKNRVELNRYDRSTFYAVESEKGYADYPFSKEFSIQLAA